MVVDASATSTFRLHKCENILKETLVTERFEKQHNKAIIAYSTWSTCSVTWYCHVLNLEHIIFLFDNIVGLLVEKGNLVLHPPSETFIQGSAWIFRCLILLKVTFGASQFSPFAFTTHCDGETYRYSKLFSALFCSYLF